MTDLRYAIRQLIKSPGFTFTAVLTLALGIGANSAIFSVIEAVLLRPLPYPEPTQLYQFSETRPDFGEMSIAYPNYLDWRATQRSFTDLSVYRRDDFNLSGTGAPETLHGAFVTSSYFQVMGLAPILGRVFSERDDRAGGSNVIVLSEALWRWKFGANPNAVGRTVVLNGISYEVIGVMPSALTNPPNVDLYAPFGYYANRPYLNERSSHPGLFGIARLKKGVSIEQAEADFAVICKRLESQYPASNSGAAVKFTRLLETTVGEYRATLWLLFGAVGFVLLIACANLANLLLARAAGRRQEIAVRAALGASRGRIVRQLLSESVLLSVIGGGVGLFIAIWGVDAIATLAPKGIPRFEQAHLDVPVLAFAAVLSLGTGFFFGLLPAWKLSTVDLNSVLQEMGRGKTQSLGRQRSQALLVVGQVALACVLLTGAGLLLKSFAALQAVRLGFEPAHLLTMRLKLPGLKYRDNPKADLEIGAFHRQLLEKVAALPGIEAVALSDNAPFSSELGQQESFAVTGRPDPKPGEEPFMEAQCVSPSYFKTMRVALLQGRPFNDDDSSGKLNVVIIDEAFARRFFPGQNPLGQRINDLARSGPRRQFIIVGVAANARHEDLAAISSPLVQAYYPLAQFPALQTTLLIRSKGNPFTTIRAVRAAVLSLDPTQPVFDIHSMNDRLGQSLTTRRLSMILVTLFSGLALVLAALGIYGTLAYTVAQRAREIGIRLALGAQRAEMFRLIVGRSMFLVGIGLLTGLAAAAVFRRLLAGFLYNVGPDDPVILIAAALTLSVAALLASYLPARRAARVDPMVALRYE